MGNSCKNSTVEAKVAVESTLQISLPEQVQFKQEDINKKTIMMNLLQREVECYKKQNELGFQMIEIAKDKIRCQKEEAQKNQDNVEYENYLKQVEDEKEEKYKWLIMNIQRDIQIQKDRNMEIIEATKQQFNIQEPQNETQYINNLSRQQQEHFDRAAQEMNELERFNSVVMSLRQNEEMMMQKQDYIESIKDQLLREITMLKQELVIFKNSNQQQEEKSKKQSIMRESAQSSSNPVPISKGRSSYSQEQTKKVSVKQSSKSCAYQTSQPSFSQRGTAQFVRFSEPVQYAAPKQESIERNETSEDQEFKIERKSKLIPISSVSRY